MKKVEKLGVAGYAAPRMRDRAEVARRRRVTLTDKDGNVKGYVSLEEVQKSLLRKQEIEFDTLPGKKRTNALCIECGVFFRLNKLNAHQPPKACPKCRLHCHECGGKLGHATYRNGGRLCQLCSGTKRAKPKGECACGTAIPSTVVSCAACRKARTEAGRRCACGALTGSVTRASCKACVPPRKREPTRFKATKCSACSKGLSHRARLLGWTMCNACKGELKQTCACGARKRRDSKQCVECFRKWQLTDEYKQVIVAAGGTPSSPR